jgi:hypothetical protein
MRTYLGNGTLGGGVGAARRKPLRCRYCCTFFSISSSSIAAAPEGTGRTLGFRAPGLRSGGGEWVGGRRRRVDVVLFWDWAVEQCGPH